MNLRPIDDSRAIRIIFEQANYPEKWDENYPASSEKHLVLGVFEPELVGCFPLNFYKDCAEIHAAFLWSHRGNYAVRAAKEAFKWIFQTTKYRRIVAEIEAANVERYAERCGMKKIGNRWELWANLSRKSLMQSA